MNILNKLKNNECTKKEILDCLDNSNPIVLYEAISNIVRNNNSEKDFIDKLIQLSDLLSDKYKMLGYYKIGHVAMGALLRLGINQEIVFKESIDSFDKEVAEKFSQDGW